VRAFTSGADSFSHQFRCLDKFGRTMWIREEVGIVTLTPGKWQCTGVCMDVSDEQRLNDQLRQQSELLELSHDAIIVRDEQGEILYWNGGAEHLYGWDRTEAIGRNIHEILNTGESSGDFNRDLGQRGFWAGTARHTARDGRQFTVDSRHLLVQRTDGVKVVLEASHELSPRMDGAEAIASV
jgi:PAS domain S-box-containing protein